MSEKGQGDIIKIKETEQERVNLLQKRKTHKTQLFPTKDKPSPVNKNVTQRMEGNSSGLFCAIKQLLKT